MSRDVDECKPLEGAAGSGGATTKGGSSSRGGGTVSVEWAVRRLLGGPAKWVVTAAAVAVTVAVVVAPPSRDADMSVLDLIGQGTSFSRFVTTNPEP